MAYVKLFQSMLTSTVWSESDSTRIVFVTMLLMADKNGEVLGSIPGIARFAGVSIDSCSAAIERLSSPDKYSSSKLADGRRIVAIDGGWELVNHAKYREMASKEDSQHSAAERKRRQREREEAVTHGHGDVTHGHGESRGVTENWDIADVPPASESEIHNTIAPAKPSRAGNGILLPEPQKAGFQESTLTPNGSAVAPATPSQEKGSDLLENEETVGNTLFSQFDGLHDTFPALAKTGAFPAKETANAGHAEDSSKAKRKKHERNALLDALVVLDGTVLEFATGPAWSRAAAALKTIREVSPNVTASEIEAASRSYKRKFPDAICSSSALAKWWGSLQVPEPKSAYPSYSIGAPLTPEQKAEGEARANEMRQFLRANLTTT